MVDINSGKGKAVDLVTTQNLFGFTQGFDVNKVSKPTIHPFHLPASPLVVVLMMMKWCDSICVITSQHQH
jgi:hypothetical protein